MRRKLIGYPKWVVLFWVLISQSIYAQENSALVKPTKLTTVSQNKTLPDTLSKSFGTTSNVTPVRNSGKIPQEEWTLETYQLKVDELQIKIDWVKSNPEENQKAIDSGWFDKAYTALKAAKDELSSFKIKCAEHQQMIDKLKLLNEKLTSISNDSGSLKKAKESGDYDTLVRKIEELQVKISKM